MRGIRKNYFYIIYDDSAQALPVAYCDNFTEVCLFFGKKGNQMSSLINKHRHKYNTFRTDYIKQNGTNLKFSVSCFYAETENNVKKVY